MQVINSTSRYKAAPAEDIEAGIDLVQNTKPLDDYDIVKLLKVNEQFVKEQQNSRTFRLHGSLNLISPLNNRPKLWNSLNIAVQEHVTVVNAFSLPSDFECYIGYVNRYTPVFGATSGYYQSHVKLLTPGQPIRLIGCGFSKNIFQEQVYNYIIDNEIDLTTLVATGLPASYPVTELVLVIKPKNGFNYTDFSAVMAFAGDSVSPLSVKGFTQGFTPTPSFQNQVVNLLKPTGFAHLSDSAFLGLILAQITLLFQANNLSITIQNITLNKELILRQSGFAHRGTLTPFVATGDEILGGIIRFNTDTIEITPAIPQNYEVKQLISTPTASSTALAWTEFGFIYNTINNNLQIELSFLYNPLITIPVLGVSAFQEVSTLNDIDQIPPYSLTDTGNNQVKWRDILSPGFIEPNSGKGFDFPFINGHHYVFNKATVFMRPNIASYNTFRLFKSTLSKAKVINFTTNG